MFRGYAFDDENARGPLFDNEKEAKYEINEIGLFEATCDFRDYFSMEERENKPPKVELNVASLNEPPVTSAGAKYTDLDFPFHVAVRKNRADVFWKRPGEFMEKPQLITDGITRFDIGQGEVGNCWFLAALTVLVDNKKLLQRIITEDAYNAEKGIFHTRFFKFGRWEDVYVDDYLPVKYGQLWGAKSRDDKNELWVALLEKALAKLFGSYDSIAGGRSRDAFFYLTGGTSEEIDITEGKLSQEQIFSRITNALKTGNDVTCSVPIKFDNVNGLVGGHEYAVVAVEKIKQAKLVRLRNPWGTVEENSGKIKGEWLGPWSDGSKEWETISDRSKYPRRKDGEFFISIEHLMYFFSDVTICSLIPDLGTDETSEKLKYAMNIFGEWKGKTAGGFDNLMQNPRFAFTISEKGILKDGKTPIVFQLIQHMKKRKENLLSIRCDVFKVFGDKVTPQGHCIVIGRKYESLTYRQGSQATFRHNLKPGKYLIVPSTYDSGQEKPFLIRLFTAQPVVGVKNVSDEANLMELYELKIKKYHLEKENLTFEKVMLGCFVNGVNAGGWISNQTFSSNPQYLISIRDATAVQLLIDITQISTSSSKAIGIMLFPVPGSINKAVDMQVFNEQYFNSPKTVDNSVNRLSVASSFNMEYKISSGYYVAVVFTEHPNTETTFSLVMRADSPFMVKGFQTGLE